MARIAIDATAFDGAPGSGQYRYAVDLVRGLWRLEPGHDFLVLGSGAGPPGELREVFASGSAWRYRQLVPSAGRGALVRDQLRWSLALQREGMDLLHALHTFVPLPLARRTVCTIHDLMFEIFPEYAPNVRSRAYRLHRWTVRHRVRHLIAISGTTAADLGGRWGVDGGRITVVPLGSEIASRARVAGASPEAVRAEALIVSPYNLEPRKNVGALLRAVAQVRRELPSVRLALFGHAAVTPEREAAFVKEVGALGLEGAVERTGHLGLDDLAALYARAALFVFPSLYEGFGLPLLEAMAAGTCVVARRASAMAELVGDAGVLVETERPEAMADAMRTLLQDGGRRAYLGTKARERASAFSVQRMAEGTLDVYHRALVPRS